MLFDELCSCQTFSVTIPGTEMAVARKRAVCWKEKTAPISNPRPTAVNIPKNTRMNFIAGTSSEGWFGNGTSRMGVRIANAANVFATGISTLAPACQSISLRFLFLDSDPTRIIPPSASTGDIFPPEFEGVGGARWRRERSWRWSATSNGPSPRPAKALRKFEAGVAECRSAIS